MKLKHFERWCQFTCAVSSLWLLSSFLTFIILFAWFYYYALTILDLFEKLRFMIKKIVFSQILMITEEGFFSWSSSVKMAQSIWRMHLVQIYRRLIHSLSHSLHDKSNHKSWLWGCAFPTFKRHLLYTFKDNVSFNVDPLSGGDWYEDYRELLIP